MSCLFIWVRTNKQSRQLWVLPVGAVARKSQPTQPYLVKRSQLFLARVGLKVLTHYPRDHESRGACVLGLSVAGRLRRGIGATRRRQDTALLILVLHEITITGREHQFNDLVVSFLLARGELTLTLVCSQAQENRAT